MFKQELIVFRTLERIRLLRNTLHDNVIEREKNVNNERSSPGG